ncbi:MAG: protein kinase [Methanoregula sp.]|nr:protein kinase [Methanoregula sp.]
MTMVKPVMSCRIRDYMPHRGVLAVFLLVFVIIPVSANVITYDGSGTFGSIQEVINNASAGDSIFLAGGTYYGNILIDRSIVFGALDTNNSPNIVSGASGAGITLAADGVTINGITITGDAPTGLLILSNNNRVSSNTIRSHTRGIDLKSASNNIVSGNVLINNSIGIAVDRNSNSNTFYLNDLNNTVDAFSQSSENTWFSNLQDYQYRSEEFSGPLGNFWEKISLTDSNADGVGDSSYRPENSGSAIPGETGILDQAPLVSAPGEYTLQKLTLPVNATQMNEVFRSGSAQVSGQPGDLQGSLPQGGSDVQYSSNTAPQTSQGTASGPPPNSLYMALSQFWWVIAGAVILSVVAGIWFERTRKKKANNFENDTSSHLSLGNPTLVKKSGMEVQRPLTQELQYAASLPPALEKKYPRAQYLAEGGVSRVFKAWDEKEGRDVAVKVPIRFDEVTGSQFTKELNIWEGLHHKNIVEIYAANIFPLPYIEMEYVDSSLAAMPFPLSKEKATSIVLGIADGIRYAHNQGIIHRDIKPENILVTPEGIPKITDWGLSKAEGTKQSGFIGFSLEYAAPEQLAPNIYGEPGPWTDIYQIGVLYYEMLTGRVPFGGGGMGEVTHSILHDTPVPALSDGENAARINAIITKCLQKKPADRYASVSDLISDLMNVTGTRDLN